MSKTTQDGADVVERLRALARHEHSDLSIGHEAADIIDVHRKTIEIANAGWNKDHSELIRLRVENERLKSIEALVREYVSERDAPVQDIGYRAALLNRIREALQETSNG